MVLPRSTKRVLVLADNEPTRMSAARTLGGAGYQVETAASELEARALVSAFRHPFDLLVCDFHGPEAASRVRSRVPGMRMICTCPGRVPKCRASDNPGMMFLPRPFTGDELLEGVERALLGDSGPGTRMIANAVRESARGLTRRHWTEDFDGTLVWGVRTLLVGYVAKVESDDIHEVESALSEWRHRLNFEGVPDNVMIETGSHISSALLHMKSADRRLAAAALDRALRVWGWQSH